MSTVPCFIAQKITKKCFCFYVTERKNAAKEDLPLRMLIYARYHKLEITCVRLAHDAHNNYHQSANELLQPTDPYPCLYNRRSARLCNSRRIEKLTSTFEKINIHILQT